MGTKPLSMLAGDFLLTESLSRRFAKVTKDPLDLEHSLKISTARFVRVSSFVVNDTMTS